MYSSCWLFVACFSLDTVLQQLICHDMFLPCLSNSTCCQIKPAAGRCSVGRGVPSVENAITSSSFVPISLIKDVTFTTLPKNIILLLSPTTSKSVWNDLNVIKDSAVYHLDQAV